MKPKLSALSRTYEVALGKHMRDGANSGLRKAAGLGREAVSLGLESLDLARIHERALLTVIAAKGSSAARDGFLKRAQVFFIEAITPIERTHPAAATAKLHRDEVSEALNERTDELAVSKRDVKKRIIQRKAAEETLKSRKKHYSRLLAESQTLHEELRRLAYRVISAQEDERGQISRALHDEIAQGLLAINVRLLTLQHKGTGHSKKLLKDIASTQRLIEKSAKAMRRLGREFRTPHEK